MHITREAVRHPEGSLRCLHLRQRAFRGGLHRHRHLELTWIEHGQGLRWVGDSVEPFFDGDLVLLGSDLVHQWASRGEPGPEGCVATVLQFPADQAALARQPELAALPALLARAGRGLALRGATHAQATAVLQRLRSLQGAHRLAAFVELLAVLLEAGADLHPLATHRPAGGAERVDRLLQWIEAHLAEDLRVEHAAALVHVSPAAFARFFRRELGKSFTAYVNDARCGWAALRLLQGREPVAAIAQGCGFSTLSNFGEQFRRRYGVSPREFRRLG